MNDISDTQQDHRNRISPNSYFWPVIAVTAIVSTVVQLYAIHLCELPWYAAPLTMIGVILSIGVITERKNRRENKVGLYRWAGSGILIFLIQITLSEIITNSLEAHSIILGVKYSDEVHSYTSENLPKYVIISLQSHYRGKGDVYVHGWSEAYTSEVGTVQYEEGLGFVVWYPRNKYLWMPYSGPPTFDTWRVNKSGHGKFLVSSNACPNEMKDYLPIPESD